MIGLFELHYFAKKENQIGNQKALAKTVDDLKKKERKPVKSMPRWILFFFLVAFCHTNLLAQNALIKGKVIDAQSKTGLADVRIRIKGLPEQTVSDGSGNFTLSQAPAGEEEMVFKKSGYKFIGLKTTAKSSLNTLLVSLTRQDTSQLLPAIKELNRFREQLVVITDKPYYYPREVIWLKAYLDYLNPELKDSLSRVVHIDLIRQDKKIVNSLTLSLDSGRLQGSIVLPRGIPPGPYMLRGYTNFMRNFGEGYFFYKSIPVLSLEERVEPSTQSIPAEQSKQVITADAAIYGLRKQVHLNLDVPDGGNYSISITDATQVAEIPHLKITDDWGIGQEVVKEPALVDYVTEKGVRFIGKFVNENNTAKASKLTFYRKDRVEVFDIESNANGIFQVNGLLFYDSALYFYNPVSTKSNKANRLFGKVEIQSEKFGANNIAVPGYWFKVINSNSPQRFLPNYLLPPDSRLLDEVVVKSSRIVDTSVEKLPGILGGADAIVFGSELKDTGCNALRAAIGKTAGISIFCSGCDCSVVFKRAGLLSITNTTEPLVLINNVPVSGGPSVFSSISPESIERIEFSKRLNPLYGSQGANGIIAVYLKNGESGGGSYRDLLVNKSIMVKGFSRPLSFISPDYSLANQEASVADYRSTLYWNPEIKKDAITGKYTCNFYTSDLPGKYRIVLQGVTKNHEPIYAEQFIIVKD
jgi:hypothetical protein